MTSRGRIFTKTSGKVYFIDSLTVSKDEMSITTKTENMTSFALLVLVWEGIGKLRQRSARRSYLSI